MTAKQYQAEIDQHNAEVLKRREIVQQLWEKLDRKPTVQEMAKAIIEAGIPYSPPSPSLPPRVTRGR